MKTGGTLISSIEFPGKMSLVIFTAGCMLTCPYCHNPDLIEGGDEVPTKDIIHKIRDASDFVDGVVITGGEPLIQDGEILKIMEYCKESDLLVKLETNGYYPERLERLIKLVDYVSLDVKAPFDKYQKILGKCSLSQDPGESARKSMEICLKSGVYLECRTTYVPGLLDPEDVLEIAESIKCNVYTIQQFKNKVVADARLKNVPNPSREELLEITEAVKPLVKRVKLITSEFGVEFIK
jgi:pyruvate formate lyase activating enzyme